MANIDPAVAGLVLDAVSDDDFEIFSQGLLNHTLGTEFEPTGGMHDGGQDGFVRAIRGKPSHFVQISTRPDVKAKIVHTIKRLGESGREVELITYMSSRFCPNRDIIEAEIQKEFGVEVRIRDRRWITTQCQRDETVSAMFIDRFAPQVHSMMELQGQTTQSYASSERMSILTYLEVHSDSEPQERDLLATSESTPVRVATFSGARFRISLHVATVPVSAQARMCSFLSTGYRRHGPTQESNQRRCRGNSDRV